MAPAVKAGYLVNRYYNTPFIKGTPINRMKMAIRYASITAEEVLNDLDDYGKKIPKVQEDRHFMFWQNVLKNIGSFDAKKLV